MGLLDKAKGFVDDHKDQLEKGLEKAKETVNKAGDTLNQKAAGRLPDSGTVTPVDQTPGEPPAPEAPSTGE
jgi:hypothetical protein